MFFNNLNSSAIKEIEVNDNIISVIFNSSDKVYNYEVKDEDFNEMLQNVIVNEESIGKFINTAIKNKAIVEYTNLNTAN
jgi:predicted house-cleaning noncanonical NTP pyrophosphatase (MazG superfamily)